MPRVRRRSISDIVNTRDRLIGQIYSPGQPYNASTGTARRSRIERIADRYITNITNTRAYGNMVRGAMNPSNSARARLTLQRRAVTTSFGRSAYMGTSRGSING